MRQKLIILAVFLLLGVSGGVVLAYLSGEDYVQNQIAATNTDITIIEEFDPPETIEPGCEIRKIPRIKNISSSPCYVRMNFYFSDDKARENCEEIQILEGWELGKDGYYYWHELLNPGEVTGPLFNRITIRSDVSKDNIQPFELDVYAEAANGGEKDNNIWEKMKG